MNDSVHQMSLLVGEIRGELRAVKASVENLNAVWGQREQAATEGRRTLYQKVESLSHDVMHSSAIVENLARDISVIKPTIDEFKTARDESAGAQRLGKRLWAAGISVAGLCGGGVAELFHQLRGH